MANGNPQADPDPFVAPRVDLNRVGAQRGLVRPSYGLVGVLIIVQFALIAGIAACSTILTGKTWWALASWPLGALMGAMLVGILETSRRPDVRTVVSRTHLALLSVPVWAVMVMSVFLVRGVSLPPRSMPSYWLGAALVTAIFGLLHFGVTLLGLWLGSQADFSSPDQGQQ